MLGNYIKFASEFEKLSPYELQHFCEIILCKLEIAVEGKIRSECGKTLGELHIKQALLDCMRDVLVDIRRKEIFDKQAKLEQTMSLIFRDGSLAA